MAVILVADDDPKWRRVIVKGLGPAGHDLLEASNGFETLKLVALHKPPLVITDIFMPDMDGFEAILAIRRTVPATKIVAMSGTGIGPRGYYLEAAKQLGADEMLQKPFEMANLRAIVEQLLE
jgi:CheY-like chemotaxis protein